jgi:hypothetical protein
MSVWTYPSLLRRVCLTSQGIHTEDTTAQNMDATGITKRKHLTEEWRKLER